MSTKARWVALVAALFLVGVGNAGESAEAQTAVDPPAAPSGSSGAQLMPIRD